MQSTLLSKNEDGVLESGRVLGTVPSLLLREYLLPE